MTSAAYINNVSRVRAIDRRRFLHDLAVECANGTEGYAQIVRFTDLLACIASPECPDVQSTFARLVRAVDDLKVYCRSRESEGDWLVDHNIEPTEETRETYYGVLEIQIEAALDALMAHEVAA